MSKFIIAGLLVVVAILLVKIVPPPIIQPTTCNKYNDVDIIAYSTVTGTAPAKQFRSGQHVILKIRNPGRFSGGIITWNQISGLTTIFSPSNEAELILRDLSPGVYGFSVKVTLGCDEHFSEEENFEVLPQESVGFDFGTTWSCVAYVEEGIPTLLHSKGKEICIESLVGFKMVDSVTKEIAVVVGQDARNMLHTHPKETVYQVKRLLGKRYHQVNPKDFRYDITSSRITGLDSVAVVIEFPDGTTFHLLPEEISALIMSEMKRLAEEFFNHPITDVVISVPAGSTHSQRRATADAARIADLNVISLEVEPTMALIALSWSDLLSFGTVAKDILITDLGGGTSDFSYARVWKEDGVLRAEVIATGGDQNLGGEDFTQCIAADLQSEVMSHYGESFVITPKMKALLHSIAETTKKQLSFMGVKEGWMARFEIGGKFFDIVYKTERFEQKCKFLFDKIEPTLKALFNEEILKSHEITKEKLDKVIMVGGTSYIPGIIKRVRQFFAGTKAQVIAPDNEMTVSPLHAVPLGAACSAEIHASRATGIALPTNTLPLALGVGAFIRTEHGLEEIFSRFFDKHTPYPNSMSRSGFTTLFDNQKVVTIKVYQEGRTSTAIKDCDFVGQYDIEIPPHPAGRVKIQIIFSLTESGLLEVTAIPDGNLEGQKGASFHVADQEARMFQDQLNISREKIRKLFLGTPVDLLPPPPPPSSLEVNEIDIAFVLDLTGSMQSWIQESKTQIMQMVNSLKYQIQNSFTNPNYELRIGFVGYRDKEDVTPLVTWPLSTKIEEVSDFITRQPAVGGGDWKEDVLGGLQAAVALEWKKTSYKFIVLIGDSPCHDHQIPQLVQLLKSMKEQLFKFAFVHMTTGTDPMLQLFKQNYGEDIKVIKLGNPDGLGFQVSDIVFNALAIDHP